MEIGLGIDAQRLALSDEDQRSVASEAVRLGYTSLWTPAAGPAKREFELCGLWHEASGLATGISVVPLSRWTIDEIAEQTRLARERTRDSFTLGIGAGAERHAPIRMMREAVAALRDRLDGAPIFLGALGPQMLDLAGARYDGAALNWSSPEQVVWSRERVAAAARRAGRDADGVRIHEYIRVCVDQDEAAARRALALMMLSYAMARPGADPMSGYRGHFARMGFGPVLEECEALRARGGSEEALAAHVPDELLRQVGYWGKPAGARDAFARLARGLDVAVVRVLAATRNDVEGVRLAMRACAPHP
ncbi:MAG TPA: LLM class flavin-dependent oxidoreductase [Candidatus Limnocylindria bacterium]